MSEYEIPKPYQNPLQVLTEKYDTIEAALVQIMGDVVSTSNKWIELSNAVREGKITDVKVLEEEYSKFMILTVMLGAEILASQYGDRVSLEATRNATLRSLPFDL